MIALLLFAAIPNVAYAAAERELTPREERIFWRYAYRVCGPEGTVDTDPVPDVRGRYYAEPHCNRDGWNGHRYAPPIFSKNPEVLLCSKTHGRRKPIPSMSHSWRGPRPF